MDPRLGIDELRNVNVTGGRNKGIGVISGEVRIVGILLGEEGDHIAHSHLRGFGQVLVEAHGNIGRRSFGPRPEQMFFGGLALMDDELKGAREEGLKGCDVDFSVALAGMAVAGFKESAAGVDRVEDDRAGGKLLVVHVAAMHPGRRGVPFAGGFRRRDPDGPEEGMQRDGNAGGKCSGHPGTIERDDLGAAIGEVIREKTATGSKAIAGEVGVELDLEDADLKDVAWFSFSDGNRAGEDVASRAAVSLRDFVIDVCEPGRDVGGGDSLVFEPLRRSAGGGGLHDDDVAGVDGQHWFGVCGVVAPRDRAGRGEKRLGTLSRGGVGRKERSGGEQKGEAHSRGISPDNTLLGRFE